MPIAKGIHGDASEHIDMRTPLLIDHGRPGTADQRQRRGAVIVHHAFGPLG